MIESAGQSCSSFSSNRDEMTKGHRDASSDSNESSIKLPCDGTSYAHHKYCRTVDCQKPSLSKPSLLFGTSSSRDSLHCKDKRYNPVEFLQVARAKRSVARLQIPSGKTNCFSVRFRVAGHF